MNYTNSIKTAILCFPILSIILMLPFLVYYYRKYGSISFLRVIIFFSFVFYLLCAYFLIILPLPSIESTTKYTGQYYNLKPFYFIPDFITSDKFEINNFNTYLLFFKDSKYLEAIFNVLLVIPFGIYLRYYFKCNFLKTIALSFLLSLFFELTQLSGLYFIYPRPYRLFDINDLINNTIGGTIGYLLTPLLSFFLPSRDKIDTKDYIKGNYVSILRRLCALIIDYIIVISIYLLINIKFKHIYIYFIINFIYFTLIPYFFNGYKIGNYIVKYRCINNSGSGISFTTYLVKWIFIHVFILNGWFIIYTIYKKEIYTDHFTLFYLIITAIFFIHFIYCLLFKKNIFYDKLLNLIYISDIGSDENEKI